MKNLILEAKTHKAKNRLAEVAHRFHEWDGTWLIADERATIQAREGVGPWWLLVPSKVPLCRGHEFSRWVHALTDKDFAVREVPNVKVTGAAPEKG